MQSSTREVTEFVESLEVSFFVNRNRELIYLLGHNIGGHRSQLHVRCFSVRRVEPLLPSGWSRAAGQTGVKGGTQLANRRLITSSRLLASSVPPCAAAVRSRSQA